MKIDHRYIWLLLVPAAFLTIINVNLLVEYVAVISVVTLVAGFTHVIRKVLVPYADMGDLIDQAKLNSTGAGLAFLGMSVMVAAFALVMAALVHVGH